jgi:hypothetical protein
MILCGTRKIQELRDAIALLFRLLPRSSDACCRTDWNVEQGTILTSLLSVLWVASFDL